MSIVEFQLAMDGYLESKGLKNTGVTWSEVEEIMKEHNISEKSYSIHRKSPPVEEI